MAYQPTQTKTEGGQKEVRVGDDDLKDIMSSILTELKKLNLQLEIMTEEKIENSEVEY